MTAIIERPGAMPVKQPKAQPDGNIHAALDELRRQISNLVDPVIDILDDEPVEAPSMYNQLRAATRGSQSQTGTGGGSKSRPPFWTDAVVLLTQIDNSVAEWNPGHCCQPATLCRLQVFLTRRWRPQDTNAVRKIAGIIGKWTDQINKLLSPVHYKHISAPCPACDARTGLRRDSAGELVRVPALQIIPDRGCVCVVCHATWTPDLYLHLCRVLGFELPAGVLE